VRQPHAASHDRTQLPRRPRSYAINTAQRSLALAARGRSRSTLAEHMFHLRILALIALVLAAATCVHSRPQPCLPDATIPRAPLCPPAAANPPAHPCPPCALNSISRQTFDLELDIVDGIAWRRSCDGISPHRVLVRLDGKQAGEVVLTCSPEIRAPALTVPLTVPAVTAGGHDVEVEDTTTGKSSKANLVVPALELSDDARTVFAGAHVRIWVGQSIEIGPVAAMSLPGL
jgi:hypothetical protein